MTDAIQKAREANTAGEWRYSINYGPEGEANYAFVYDGGGHLVSNLKIHHAIAVVEQMNARAAQAERMARLEEALRTVKSMRSIDTIAPAVHEFEREKRSEAWAKIDEMVARALSQEGSEPS